MKIVTLLLLFQLTKGQTLFPEPSSHSRLNDNDFITRWKITEAAFKEIIDKVLPTFSPSLTEIFSNANISANCTISLIEFFRGISQMKYWAFAMIDASGVVPAGIFGGTMSALGDFDTCINLKTPKFGSKYCLLDVYLPLPEKEILQPVEKEISDVIRDMEPGSLFEQLSKISSYFYVGQLRSSLCLPSACARSEVESLTSEAMKLMKFSLNVVVPYCEEKIERMNFSSGDISIIILLCALVSLVIMATMIDIFYHVKTIIKPEVKMKEKSISVKCMLCFSAYSNFKRLMQYDDNPDSLSIFHGMRVLSILWVMISHTYFMVNYYALGSLLTYKDIAKDLKFQPIINGFLSVENFFFMSSVLVTYICMRMKGKISFTNIFLKRFYRLTPSLMITVACVCIMGHFGSGPLWRETVINALSNKCKERGWFTMLYLNNYFYSSDTCLGWTWYLSADTQLFMICLYAIILLRKNTEKGLKTIGFLLVAGILSTAIAHVYYNLPPVYLQSYHSFDDWYYFGLRGYTPSHIHLPVSCIGMYVGYILAVKEVHIPRRINVIGWQITCLTLLYLIFGTYYWNQGEVPGVFVSALYGSTYRSVYTLCLAFITVSCSTGNGGVIGKFLSWKGFVPLGRLTFMVYLLHYAIIYWYIGTTRTNITYNHRSFMFIYCAIVVISFIASFILDLIIESPFSALANVIWSKPQLEKSMIAKGAEIKLEKNNFRNAIKSRNVNGAEKKRKELI